MRKRTVQSVLARRHMFKNGGMVPPPAQPAGILASSPSLVDAVSNDALSDMGGGTLSMAQGGAAVNMQPSYVFNQGGIAKLANGGAYYDSPAIRMQSRPDQQLLKAAGVAPDALTVDRMPAGIKVGGSQFIPVETTVSEIINESPILKYNRIFNPDIDPDSIKNPLPPEKTSRFDKLMFGISNKLKSAGSTIGDVYDYAMEPGGSNKTFGQISAINTMVRRRPDLAPVIEDFSSRIIQQNPKISEGELSVIVAGALSEQQEGVGGYDPNSVESQAGMGAVGDGGAEEYLFNKYAQPYREQSEELAAEDEFERFRKGYLGEGLVDQEGGVAQGLPIEDPSPESVVPGTEKVKVKEEIDMQGILPPKIKPSAPEKPGDLPADASQKANQTIKQVQAAAESGDSEEVKKGIEEYAAEFKAAMPEYEGKSQYESGMDFVKMGMAIAAGQSPNAIENISKGVLGTIDNFTSDEKEKRLYKRQVALSGAKYALQKVSKDEDRALALAKEGRGLKTVFATQDVLNPDGSLRAKKGTSFFITNDEIHSGVYDGQFEAGTTLAIERLKANAKKVASMLDKSKMFMVGQKKAGGMSDEYVNKRVTQYKEDSLKMSDYATQMALIDSSFAINKAGRATGVGSYINRKINGLYNAFNLDRGKGAKLRDVSIKDIDNLNVTSDRKERLKQIRNGYSLLDKAAEEGRDSEQFLAQQQELANLLIKEILGEGSKNVSNIDRQLASEIVGLYGGTASITADPAIIAQRLNRIRDRVLKNYDSTNTSMKATEVEFSDMLERGGRTTVLERRLNPVRRDALSAARKGLQTVSGRTQKNPLNLGGYKGSRYRKETDADGVVRYVFK
jgi:hypothetical protein